MELIETLWYLLRVLALFTGIIIIVSIFIGILESMISEYSRKKTQREFEELLKETIKSGELEKIRKQNKSK